MDLSGVDFTPLATVLVSVLVTLLAQWLGIKIPATPKQPAPSPAPTPEPTPAPLAPIVPGPSAPATPTTPALVPGLPLGGALLPFLMLLLQRLLAVKAGNAELSTEEAELVRLYRPLLDEVGAAKK